MPRLRPSPASTVWDSCSLRRWRVSGMRPCKSTDHECPRMRRGLGNSNCPDYKPRALAPPIHIAVIWGAKTPRPASTKSWPGRAQPWRFEGLRQWECGHEDPAGWPGEARSIGLRASRRSDVPPFIVMDVMEAAAAREALGASVIHMEVGQPGTPAPRAALDAVKRALDRETLGYTVALGLPALREPHRRSLPPALRRRGRARAGGGDDGVVGGLRAWRSWPCSTPAPRWRCRRPAIPAIAIS